VKKDSKAVSALSEGGICMFFNILKDPEVHPLQIIRHTVVPGQIMRDGVLYHQVSDKTEFRKVSIPKVDLSSFLSSYAPEVRWRLVVEETFNSHVLETSFEIITRPISSDTSREDSWNYISVGVTAMSARILGCIKVRSCSRCRVRIKIPPGFSPTPTIWTGKCSEATTAIIRGDAKLSRYCPDQGEWIIIRSMKGVRCEVMRRSNILLYSVLWHLEKHRYQTVMLTIMEGCFLDCLYSKSYPIGYPDSRSVEIHSIIDNVPSHVILMKLIEWNPQEDHEDEAEETTNSSTNAGIHTIGLKNRAFYDQQRKEDLEGFLKRRGIEFRRMMNKYDIITLLENDDIQNPDAVLEDGFLDEDSEITDVSMDDVV
jgi:hypothetical protein